MQRFSAFVDWEICAVNMLLLSHLMDRFDTVSANMPEACCVDTDELKSNVFNREDVSVRRTSFPQTRNNLSHTCGQPARK